MRRAHMGNEPARQYGVVEEENEQMEALLHNKVKALKSLTIEIGDEVRSQNSFLDTMDTDFDASSNFLTSTMGRLKKIASSGGCRFTFYLILFCLFVFFVLWMVIRFR